MILIWNFLFCSPTLIPFFIYCLKPIFETFLYLEPEPEPEPDLEPGPESEREPELELETELEPEPRAMVACPVLIMAKLYNSGVLVQALAPERCA